MLLTMLLLNLFRLLLRDYLGREMESLRILPLSILSMQRQHKNKLDILLELSALIHLHSPIQKGMGCSIEGRGSNSSNLRNTM